MRSLLAGATMWFECNSQTRWWTPLVREVIRLKESCRTSLPVRVHRQQMGIDRPSVLQLQWFLKQKAECGRSSEWPWRPAFSWPHKDSGKPPGDSREESSPPRRLYSEERVVLTSTGDVTRPCKGNFKDFLNPTVWGHVTRAEGTEEAGGWQFLTSNEDQQHHIWNRTQRIWV